MARTPCPDDSELLVPVVDETVAGEVRGHVEACPYCRQRLDRLRAEVLGLRRVAESTSSRSQLETGRATVRIGSRTTAPCDAPAAPSPPVPQAIGKYVVAGLLGEGGQAVVYRVIHPGLNKELVLKVSRRPVSRERADRDRLVQEARLLADLDHPSLARVYDADFWEDRPFVVMEHVRGRTLAEWLRHQRPTPRQTAALVGQLARALAAAHRAGVVHLDLKPSNIMIDESGRPRILDFGMARMCQPCVGDSPSPSFGGTPDYTAPEQARGDQKSIGPGSDLFGLGAVLYEMLVGSAPFHDQTAQKALQRARRCEFDRSALRQAKVPRGLERICLKALAADPAERQASAEGLAADLERFVNRPRKVRRFIAAGVVLLGLMAVAGYWLLAPRPIEVPAGPHFVIARVQRDQWSYELPAALPLLSSDQLRIDCPVPRGFQPRMFSCDVDGKWEEYAGFTVKREGRFDYLQADARWVGKGAGTRVVLVCAGRSRPLADEELQKTILADRGPWEALPRNLLVWMDWDFVREGPPTRSPLQSAQKTAVDRVEERLEQLRLQLRDCCDYFVAVAYPHAGK